MHRTILSTFICNKYRFVPTHLRVKRDEGPRGGGVQKPKKPAAPQYSSGLAPQQVKFVEQLPVLARMCKMTSIFYVYLKARTQPSGGQMRAPPKEKKTKDDAYADFMKEMQDLL